MITLALLFMVQIMLMRVLIIMTIMMTMKPAMKIMMIESTVKFSTHFARRDEKVENMTQTRERKAS